MIQLVYNWYWHFSGSLLYHWAMTNFPVCARNLCGQWAPGPPRRIGIEPLLISVLYFNVVACLALRGSSCVPKYERALEPLDFWIWKSSGAAWLSSGAAAWFLSVQSLRLAALNRNLLPERLGMKAVEYVYHYHDPFQVYHTFRFRPNRLFSRIVLREHPCSSFVGSKDSNQNGQMFKIKR